METVAPYIKDVDDLSGTMLTNEEKKKKIEDMRDNLEVKKLEQDVEKILVSQLEVKDAKERIKSLKHILHLLSRYSEDEDEENESKKDSKVTKETETQTNESMITKTDIGTSTSEEQPLVPEYVKDEDNCESEENKLYEKNTDKSTEKELDKSKVDETEKDNEKTEEIKLHTVEHHEEKHEIEPEHVPEKKVDESKGENDNTDCEKEKNVKPKEEEDVPLKSAMKEEKKENKDEYVKDDSVTNKQKKQVTFDLDEDNGKEEENQNELQNQVAKALLILHEDASGESKAKIDEDYEKFPSSQVSGEQYCEKLKEKYTVMTEDISDDEKEAEKVENEKKNEQDIENDKYVTDEGKYKVIKETEKDITDNVKPEVTEQKKEGEVLEEEKIEEKTDTLTIEPVQIDGNDEAEDLRMKHSLDLPDDLVYVESGSDFEDNLMEKWKDIKKGTKLRR